MQVQVNQGVGTYILSKMSYVRRLFITTVAQLKKI